MPNRKKYLAVLAIAVLIIVTAGLTFTFLFNAQSPAQAVVAKSPTAGYIENSKIYLLSANSSYGDYQGSQCFIITVTVRNDYTIQNPPDNSSHVNTGSAFFILSAKAYDKTTPKSKPKDTFPLRVFQVIINKG